MTPRKCHFIIGSISQQLKIKTEWYQKCLLRQVFDSQPFLTYVWELRYLTKDYDDNSLLLKFFTSRHLTSITNSNFSGFFMVIWHSWRLRWSLVNGGGGGLGLFIMVQSNKCGQPNFNWVLDWHCSLDSKNLYLNPTSYGITDYVAPP